MGLLSQIENESPAAAQASATPWKNVALRIASYDIENRITTGVDIVTGETVRIKLDEPARVGRDDIDVWSLDRFKVKNNITSVINNKAVVPGDESEAGVIIFEAVRPSKVEGVMEARWSVTASHSALDASVFRVMARPIAAKEIPGHVNANMGIEMVRTITAAPVANKAEVGEQIANVLSQSFTQAVVRAQDEDGKVLSTVVRRPFTPELKALTNLVNKAGYEAEKAGKSFNEIKAIKSRTRAGLAEQFKEADQQAIDLAAPEFFAKDRMGQLIARLNETQLTGLKLEVFGLEQVYPGTKYKEALQKFVGFEDSGKPLPGNSKDATSFRRDWSMDGKGFGFGETFIALRQHEEGGMQYTKIIPATTRPVLYASLNDIQTSNIQPATAPVMVNASSAHADSIESVNTPAASASAPVAPMVANEPSMDRVDDLSNKLASASRINSRR